VAIELRGVCPLLQVFDMPTSIAFYTGVLDFQIVQSSQAGDDFAWAWLRRGDAELMLNTAYEDDARPPAPEAARVAGHQDTALFFGCPDVDAAYQHLCAHGLAVEAPVVRSYGMKQVYVKDPDGFVLCFQWPAAVAGASEA
jgi:glyoxylase I family protein